MLAEATVTRGTDEWMEMLSAADVPVMRVNSVEDLKTEPHLTAVDFFEQRQHPHEGTYRSMRAPVKFAATPASVRREPPGLGEHNRELMREAGLNDAAIEALEVSGALYSMMPKD
jgi:crotonobetainyl-CoA:carnitine CoA-transferase CaiB-like acyl-CoA transferase